MIVIFGILSAVLISVLAVIMGLFIFLRPELTIEIQKKFYEKINWRLEPISMLKEISHTKIMGIFLIAVAIGVLAYIFINNI